MHIIHIHTKHIFIYVGSFCCYKRAGLLFYLFTYIFTIFPNLGLECISIRERKKRRVEKKKRINSPLCSLGPQPTIKQNLGFDAHHSKDGLHDVASGQGLGIIPVKKFQYTTSAIHDLYWLLYNHSPVFLNLSHTIDLSLTWANHLYFTS